MMGGAFIPFMTFSFGLSLTLSHFGKINLLLAVIVKKLLVSFFVSLFIGKFLGLKGVPLYDSFLEGGMPIIMLSLFFVVELGLDVQLAALCIFVTTVCSFITLPFLVFLQAFSNK